MLQKVEEFRKGGRGGQRRKSKSQKVNLVSYFISTLNNHFPQAWLVILLAEKLNQMKRTRLSSAKYDDSNNSSQEIVSLLN